MTSIAEFTLSAADFPLGRIFEDRPDAVLELDRVVPSGDTVMPYFWVEDPNRDLDAIRDCFDSLPELRSAVLMEDLGERGLFRAEWKPEYMGIMSAIAATGVTVVSATGTAKGWTFELRSASVDRFSDFQQYCDEHGIDVTLARLNRLSEMATPSEYDLTPEQYETLVLAYERGYYDEPRRTDLEALASELGITRQAVSSRLRRGYRNLVENAVLRSPSDEP
jgi:predicted DNA binding protein